MELAEAKQDIDIVEIIGQTVKLRRSGSEFSGLCPFHDETSPSFTVNPARQFFHCFGCGASGDVIDFVMRRDNCDLPTACDTLGLDVGRRPSSPGRATPAPPRRRGRESHRPKTVTPATDQWISAAGKFVEWCHDCLLADQDAMAWLAGRGLSRQSIMAHRLGWNPGRDDRALYRPRAEWGLPDELNPRTGRHKPLWLPRGWVLPLHDDQSRVIQVRIRRTREDIAEFLPDMKYRVVPGSAMATMVMGRERDSFVMTENGFDAILIHQLAGDLVGAVSTWSAQTMPDAAAHRVLARARSILVAYDYDSAGRKGAERLSAAYRSATWWPVPAGNDVGDAWAAGVDLRAWILDGLPHGCGLAASAGDGRMFSPVGNLGGQGQADALTTADDDADGNTPSCYEIELTGGHLVYVTDDRDQWEQLAAAGKTVFTRRELMRLRAALAELDENQRQALLARILDAKKVFPAAYVAGGAGTR